MSKQGKITKSTYRKLVGAYFEYDILKDMKPPIWFTEFSTKVLGFIAEQQKFNQYVIDRFNKLDSRIDNLVKVNNLKE